MEFTTLVLKYGLPMVTMALIVMCVVGIVKVFTKGVVEKKEVTENKKKWLAKLYLFIALALSYGISILYYSFILKETPWTIDCARDAGIIWTLTSPLYQIYKQFGGRKLLIALATAFKNAFKGNDKVEDLLDTLMGIVEKDVPFLTDAQREAIKTNLTKTLTGEKEDTEKKE